jgi:alpha-glucoside transport system substrate-binding protein
MYKRIWMILTFLAIASLVVAACTPAEEVTPTPEAPVAPPADTPAPPPDTPAPAEPTEPPAEPMETPTEPMETPTEPMEPTGGIDCMGAQQGDTVSMLYQWSGVEEENLNQILRPLFQDVRNRQFKPESTRDQAILDTRVQAGNPPDIAFWNIVQVEQYQDSIVPVTDLGVKLPTIHSSGRTLGTVGKNGEPSG